MIEHSGKYKGNILQPTQTPTLYKYRPRLTERFSNIVLKGSNQQHSSLSSKHLEPNNPNKNLVSAPETSIEQIKGKIQEYLTFNS